MAIIGKGTTVEYATLGGSDYTSLGEVFDVGYPELDVQDVKTTHYGTTGNLHTYIAGWAEGGEVEVQLNYDPTDQNTLHTLIRTEKSWVITLPDGAAIYFDGYVKKVSGAIPNEDRITGKVTIKVTSEPDFQPAA